MSPTINEMIPEGMPQEWYEQRITYMSEFMLPERLDNFMQILNQRTRYMTVCMENTFHTQNASAMIRNCEAFGLQDIHTIEEICRFKPNINIVKGTDKWLDFHRYSNTIEAVTALKEKGYRIVATTPHREDVTSENFDVAAGPFALVFGTEHAGISEEVATAADEFLRIPMYGFVESLNVSASAAILLNTLSGRMRNSDAVWNLSQTEKLPILLRWIMESVRDSQRIMLKKFAPVSF